MRTVAEMAEASLDDPLLQQFALDRPDEMAALLAGSDLGELSGLIESLPVRRAACLASRLPSWQLTGLLGTIRPELVARLLLSAAADEAVTLVSHLHESRYGAILETVPPEERWSLQELLEFPSHSVASLVTTGFIRVVAETPCPYAMVLGVTLDQPPGCGRIPPDSPASSTEVVAPRPNRSSPS